MQKKPLQAGLGEGMPPVQGYKPELVQLLADLVALFVSTHQGLIHFGLSQLVLVGLRSDFLPLHSRHML